MKTLSFGVLLASALSFANGAGALTIDTRSAVNPDGSAKIVDPDRQVDNLTSPSANGSTAGSKTFRSGNSTFSFGITRSDERPGFGRASPLNNFGFNRGLRGFNSDQ